MNLFQQKLNSNRLQIGHKGEEIATEILIAKGYNIIEKNWHFQKNEVDIIAIEGGCLVFVEVKTRSQNFVIDPIKSINRKKQNFLIKAANNFIQKNEQYKNFEIRFDIVIIIFQKEGNFTYEIIKDAFYPISY